MTLPAENLALALQELLTVVVRLRTARLDVTSAETFRAQVLHAIKGATQSAQSHGYTDDDIRLAVFAIIAFLDESILNLHKPIFKEWVRKPLQEEMFGRHVAGETFFQNLQQILGRRDTAETADLLEVYQLCLLLGYLGRYSLSSRGELHALMGQVEDKIQRIRKSSAALSPSWQPPPEARIAALRDPWIHRLALACVGLGTLSVLLFVLYKILLASGVRALEQLT